MSNHTPQHLRPHRMPRVVRSAEFEPISLVTPQLQESLQPAQHIVQQHAQQPDQQANLYEQQANQQPDQQPVQAHAQQSERVLLIKEQDDSSVRKNSMVMAIGTAASRVTGQIRSILLAAAIGTTGIAANAYQTGSTVPQVIFSLISGGIFNAVLVPQIVRTLKQKNAHDQLNKLITLAMTLLLGITAIMMLLTPLITRLYVNPNWDAGQRALVNAFTLWCMPQIFFYGVYLVLGQILAATGRFGMYAWSSVFANIISCSGFIFFIVLFGNASHQPLDFWNAQTLALTAGTWTLGVAVQALVLFIPLYKLGLHYRVRWGLRGLGLRSMGSVAVWSLAITIVSQITGMFISQINTGAPHAGADLYNIAGNGSYQYAYSLYILPYSLIAVSITTAIFPKISRAVSEHQMEQVHDSLHHSIRLITLYMLFFTVAMVVMPVPIILALLPSVNVHDAVLIAGPLVGLSVSLLPVSLFLLIQRTFYAFEDGKSPFIVSLIVQILQSVCMLITVLCLDPSHWASDVGWTIAIANLIALPYLFIRLRKRLGSSILDADMFKFWMYTLFAAVAAGAAGWLVLRLVMPAMHVYVQTSTLSGSMSWLQALILCVIGTVVMTAVYGGILAAGKVPEVSALVHSLTRKIRRIVLRKS